MAFTAPNFNLLMDVWNHTHLPVSSAADFTDVPVQLYIGSKGILDITPAGRADWIPPIYLRIPTTSYGDVKDGWIFGIDNGHGVAYYKARWAEFVHLGFVNEYYTVLVEQTDSSGTVPFYRQVPNY